MLKQKTVGFSILFFLGYYILPIWSCSVKNLTTPVELVSKAHTIVRARAIGYEKPPADTKHRHYGIPDSIIKFRLLELLKGDDTMPNLIWINGYMSRKDDFNDHSAPYHRVRPDGRTGSCIANTYKHGAEYLLFLNDKYTPYWDALTPVNEQLHPPASEDRWYRWVKHRLGIPNTRRVHSLRP